MTRMFGVHNEKCVAVLSPAASLALTVPIYPLGALLVAAWSVCQVGVCLGLAAICSAATGAMDAPGGELSEAPKEGQENGSTDSPPADGFPDECRSSIDHRPPPDDPAARTACSSARRRVRQCHPTAETRIIGYPQTCPAPDTQQSSAAQRGRRGVPPPVSSMTRLCATMKPPNGKQARSSGAGVSRRLIEDEADSPMLWPPPPARYGGQARGWRLRVERSVDHDHVDRSAGI
jgi:hypothetical protein